MSSKSTRMKNYNADELYNQLFRHHMMNNFSGIEDLLVHHVQTFRDSITHIVSVEMIISTGERVFANITVIAGRDLATVTQLPEKLQGKIHATW